MRFNSCRLAAIATLATAALIPAQAHHSQSMYDNKVWKTLEGTVKQMRWTFPHTWLYVEVKDANGQIQIWGTEGGNPNSIWDVGVKKDDLKPGDKVKVRCHPAVSGAAACVLGFVTPMHGDKARGDGIERAWN